MKFLYIYAISFLLVVLCTQCNDTQRANMDMDFKIISVNPYNISVISKFG
jgi:hypothetical protein